MKVRLVQAVTALAILLRTVAIAHAEGEFARTTGVFGANRRVKTASAGYDTVRGTFQVPTTFVPLNNTAQSKPSFYIGSGQDATDTEIDAGVQYEGRPIPYNDANGVQRTANPGWSVFIAVGGGGRAQSDWTNAPYGWRAGANTPNPGVTSFFLYHGINGSGQAFIEVYANGANAQPGNTNGSSNSTNGIIWWQQNNDGIASVAYPSGTNGLHVKRVVAMTQGGRGGTVSARGYAEDGSFLRGCVLSGGMAGTLSGNTFTSVPWSTVYMDQTDTGYYPGGRDKTIPRTSPARHARGHLPIINFPNMALSSRDTVFAARYDNEVVDVNLRNFRRVRGRLVRPGRPNTVVTN